MKISALLRLAAGRIRTAPGFPHPLNYRKRQHFACNAIRAAGKLNAVHEEQVTCALKYFAWRFNYGRMGAAWLACPEMGIREQQSFRVMALLFAAEMAEGDGL